MGLHVAIETRVVTDAFNLALDDLKRQDKDDSANTQIRLLRAILALAKAGQKDPEQLARYATYKCLVA
jgi:hypothetical protein